LGPIPNPQSPIPIYLYLVNPKLYIDFNIKFLI
jgi:hypothetical protein